MKVLGFLVVAVIVISYQNNGDDHPTSNTYPPFALIQLFTSQGCSSCPPADKLLREIRAKYSSRDVFVLSYHVDYWDRLGWKDPFSSKQSSELQYSYGSKFGNRSVYTPQAVINGSIHFVGSNENTMTEKLKEFLGYPSSNAIELDQVKFENEILSLNYYLSGELEGKQLHLALVSNNQSTFVAKGENKRKNLTHVNVVLSEIKIIPDRSGTLQMSWPQGYGYSKDEYQLIAYLQKPDLTISAASRISL